LLQLLSKSFTGDSGTGENKMRDQNKTKEQLLHELVEMRQRIAELEAADTERVRTEEEMRRSELQYRTTIDSMSDVIHVIDAELRFTLYNTAFRQRIKELDLEADVIGRPLFEVFPFLPHRVRDEYRQVFDTGNTLVTEESTKVETREFITETRKLPVFEGGRVARVVTVIRDITEHKRAEGRVRRLLDRQIAVNRLALALGESRDLDTIYHTIYEHVRALMGAEAFIVSLYGKETQLIQAEYVVAEGAVLDVASLPSIPLEKVSHGTQSKVIRTGRPLYVPDLRKAMERTTIEYSIFEDGRVVEGPPSPGERGVSRSALYVPMKVGGETIGVMQAQSYRLDAYSQEDTDLLSALANVAAVAIQNARLYEEAQKELAERVRAEEELHHSFERLRRTLEETVIALTSAVEIRDPYTAGHQRRVTRLACAIAEEIDLPEEQIEGLRVAGLIHDIGKINVPAEILSKPGRLTDLEFGLIKMHPQIGHDILKTIEFPWPVAQIVLQHHERMDGSGYPADLSDDDILLEARILSVADVVEAMASHRPYRSALGLDKALEEISGNRGRLYDPQVVDACLQLFTDKAFTFGQKVEAATSS
jgi:PAS domain S-box-containing protein/putative nucleotidyltransferase with HDIG domain